MRVAVVILNWNGKKLLESFLPSVVNFSQGAEIYVIDNASTDSSMAFIKENYPKVKTILNRENGGYAKGYNQALQHIQADVYALVNSDIEVTKNWLGPIVKEFKNDENTAIIQPKILDHKNKKKFEYAGAAGGFLDLLGYPYCRGRVFNSIETDQGQYNDTITVNWASGACFFIKSEVFHQLNGFDEDYFAHQEEIDLCWRANNLGKLVKYVGSSTVYHIGGATLNENNSYKTFLNFRNSLYSLVKNLPANKIILYVLIRIILDGIAGIRFVLQGKPIHCFAIIKSHLSFYKNFKKTYKKRTTTRNKKYYNTTSIVWSYYILNKKSWSKLK